MNCKECLGSGKCQDCDGTACLHGMLDDPCEACASGECQGCGGTGFGPMPPRKIPVIYKIDLRQPAKARAK